MPQTRLHEDIVNDAVKVSVKVAWILSRDVPADFDQIDIGQRQLQILFLLGHKGPCHARVLASELGMSAPTMSKMLSSLAKRGFIARDEDPNDRRAVRCRLLDKGSRLIRGGWEVDRVFGREVLGRLTPQHVSYLYEAEQAFLGVGNTAEAETGCGDSDPQQQRQSDDVIEKVICLWDKVFLDIGSILPYELCELGVRMSDIRVLQYLQQNGSIRMGSLARWMNIGQPAATVVVNRLVEQGLVVRERDHGDWRVVLCRLTDLGQRLIGSQVNPSIMDFRSRLGMLTSRQLQDLVRVLRALLRANRAIERNHSPIGNSLAS
jgi:DNA-binding MarR family transcriptional regulator